MWRIDGDQPRRLSASSLPSEATLENYLVLDPSLLGTRLLVIGRQVRTPHNKYLDLLAVDADGNLHVLELKRDKTPRDVVAQVLDYGSWVTTLTRDDVIDLANRHLEDSFESAFEAVFRTAPPDELNVELQLSIVATDLDDSSERIVNYLRGFGVPVNAVFFSYLDDGDRRYLARSWLAEPEDEQRAPRSSKKAKRAEWNGRDWYVCFGDDSERSWEDALRYGFVSAGGGEWYSRTLRNVPVGARVNVYIPQRGYVALGTTLGGAKRFDESQVRMGEDGQWVRLAEQRLVGTYRHTDKAADSDEMAEFVMPVQWHVAKPASQAYREPGMFASQLSACKLRQQFTLDRLAEHFELQDEAG